ncbi:variable surface protein [Plasmodium gonderi]|uniref:Variable surface protein n=1 Tax=Plasmodium gonderi TaxID=77519 RepID=A0A1Y1JQ58_PLAGO|nr:variable surface protein [Plasmodium gonderi]GAW84621.1 variable surface protein [Plasmodium gonderi]
MSSTINVPDDLDFKDIFPTCYGEYRNAMKNKSNIEARSYTSLCNRINSLVGADDLGFILPCQVISLYLERINSNTIYHDKRPCCIYFNYKLISELKRHNCDCDKASDCFDKMINEFAGGKKLSGVCKGYIKELEGDILNILDKINGLYDNFEELKLNSKENCEYARKCVTKYRDLLEICYKGNNKRFCGLLEIFKDEYNDHMKDKSACYDVPKFLYSSYGISRWKVVLASFIVTFAISITILILYKYNIYDLYLQPMVKKLKKIWKTKKKEQLKLIESFEHICRNLMDGIYRIEYTQVGY